MPTRRRTAESRINGPTGRRPLERPAYRMRITEVANVSIAKRLAGVRSSTAGAGTPRRVAHEPELSSYVRLLPPELLKRRSPAPSGAGAGLRRLVVYAAVGGSSSSAGGGSSGFLKRCHASRARPAESMTSGSWSKSALNAMRNTEATPATARMVMMAVSSTDPDLPCHGSDRVRRQPRSEPCGSDRDTRADTRTRKCSRGRLNRPVCCGE